MASTLYQKRREIGWTGSAGDWVGAFFCTALWPAMILIVARDIIDDMRR